MNPGSLLVAPEESYKLPENLRVIVTQYGDYILLSTKCVRTENQDEDEDRDSDAQVGGAPELQFLTADVCPDFYVSLVDEERLAKDLFTCLFKVLPYADMPLGRDDEEKLLSHQVIHDLRANSIGKLVTYGTPILLEHYLTKAKLRVRQDTVSIAFGTWELQLSEDVDSASVISLKPADKYQPENGPVAYGTAVNIDFGSQTAKRMQAVYDEDREEFVVQTADKGSQWTFRFFDTLQESLKEVKIGTPCHLMVKGLNFYIGATEEGGSFKAKYVDVKDSSTMWILLHNEIDKGGFISSKVMYYFFNVQTGLFMGEDMTLQKEIKESGLFTFESLTGGLKPLNFEEANKIRSIKQEYFGIDETTGRSACLKTIYPSAYDSETPTSFAISLGTAETLPQLAVFQVLPLEESSQLLLLLNGIRITLIYLIDDIRKEFEESLSTELGKPGEYIDPDYIVELFESVRTNTLAIKEKHFITSFKKRGIFTKLGLPTNLIDLVLYFIDLKAKIPGLKASTNDANQEQPSVAEANQDELDTIMEELEKSYKVVGETLVQLMSNDIRACAMVNKRAGDIVQHIYTEKQFIPTIMKLTQRTLSSSTDLAGMSNSFSAWIQIMQVVDGENASTQELVFSILNSIFSTVIGTEAERETYKGIIENGDFPVRKYKFAQEGSVVYVNYFMHGAFRPEARTLEQNGELFVALEDLKPPNWTLDYANFTAQLLFFYQMCYNVFPGALMTDLFPDLNITPELLLALASSTDSLFIVRTAAIKYLSVTLPDASTGSSFKHNRVFSTGAVAEFARNLADLKAVDKISVYGKFVLTYLTFPEVPQDLRDQGLETTLNFATSLFTLVKALLESNTECLQFSEVVQRCAIWALFGFLKTDLTDTKGNWISASLAEVVSHPDPENSILVNRLLVEIFGVLGCIANIQEETLLKVLLDKFPTYGQDWKAVQIDVEKIYTEVFKLTWIPSSPDQNLTPAQTPLLQQNSAYRDYVRLLPAKTQLQSTLLYSLVFALRTNFEITEEKYELLQRILTPVPNVLRKLQESLFVSGPSQSLEDIEKALKVELSETEVLFQVSNATGNKLVEAANEECAIISRKLLAFENPATSRYVQAVFLTENAYQFYLDLWIKVYTRIYYMKTDSERSAMYKMGSCIFQYCFKFMQGNLVNKRVILAKLNPFLYYLEMADLGVVIRELNDYYNIKPDHAQAFFNYIQTFYYKQSIAKTGAYMWVPTLIIGTDGSVKHDIQSVAYSVFSAHVKEADTTDETGCYGVYLKLATLCAYDNKHVRIQLQSEMPVSTLKSLLTNSEAGDIAEGVLLILSRVNSFSNQETRQGEVEDVTELLGKILTVAKKLLEKRAEIIDLVRSGYYEQVKSRVAVNTLGWYLTPEQFKNVNLLRLLSSGRRPEPVGGIASQIVTILKAYPGTSVSKDKMTKLANDYSEFLNKAVELFKGISTELGSDCDFSVFEISLQKGVADLTAYITGGGQKKPALALGGLSKSIGAPSFPVDPTFLSPRLIPFSKELLKLYSTRDILLANFSDTFAWVIKSRGESESIFLKMFEEVTKLFMSCPEQELVFPALKCLTSLFNIKYSKAAYKKVFEFWISRMIASRDIPDLISGTEFYLSFGDHLSLDRYEVLLKVFEDEQQGSKLLSKIRKSIRTESLIRKLRAKSKGHSLDFLIRKMSIRKFISGQEFESMLSLHSRLVTSYMSLLQKMCDNCNLKMQQFVHSQGSEVDVDIVSEVISFTSGLLDLTIKTETFQENQELLLTTMKAISDFCTGPCSANQDDVGKSVSLFLSINSIQKLPYDSQFSKGQDTDKYVNLRSESLHVLSTLLEGDPSQDILTSFKSFLVIDNIINYVVAVYSTVIEPNKRVIELGDFEQDPRQPYVEYALDASVFLILYQNLSGIAMIDLLKSDKAVLAFRNFFLQYSGYVEIFKPSEGNANLEDLKNLWSVSFRIPFKCKLLTEESASALIVQVSHTSKQDKLTDFMNLVEPLDAEMKHHLALHHYSILQWFSRKWRLYKSLSLFLVLLINLYVLTTFEEVRGLDRSSSLELTIIIGGGVLQAFLYFLGYVFHIIERYPLIIRMKWWSEAEEEEEMDQFYGLSDHESQKFKHILTEESVEAKAPEESSVCTSILAMLFYKVTWITIVYILVSSLAIEYPLLFPLLILTLIENKVEVQNILKAVTLNKKQLLLSAGLGVIIIYVFSVVSFLFFSNYYSADSNLECDVMWKCLITTISMGLRSGGGIGDALGPSEPTTYWPRLIFDLLFFVLIIILMMNIIFGIIIDTFGNLRDQRTELYEDINNVCYICGTSRNKIEMGGKGWSYHFQNEHSPFAYLAFLIRVETLKETELNGIESYVRKLYRKRDGTFFPSTSRLLVQALS